jgi:hypothetical protein
LFDVSHSSAETGTAASNYSIRSFDTPSAVDELHAGATGTSVRQCRFVPGKQCLLRIREHGVDLLPYDRGNMNFYSTRPFGVLLSGVLSDADVEEALVSGALGELAEKIRRSGFRIFPDPQPQGASE